MKKSNRFYSFTLDESTLKQKLTPQITQIFDVILKGTEKPLRWDTHLGGTKRDFEVRTT